MTAGLFACLRRDTGSGTLEAVLAVAHDFSSRVRRASACEVVLDVSGLGRLIGPPDEIARQLAQALVDAGEAASVALGPTQTIARVLARAETDHGPAHRPQADSGHEAHASCGRLPVAWLQELETLPAATSDRDRARIYDTLERWGITTLGALAALPAADLASRLGRRGLALQRLARGLDPAPFKPEGDMPRYVGRLELDWPIDALEPLSFVFARLLDPLSTALERADRGAAAVRLDLRLTDRSTHTRVLQLPAPMRDARVLRTLLLLDLESAPPPAAVDVVTIELDPAPARITQFSLLKRALPAPETLATLTARLSSLVGESRVGSPVLVDSHAPDAFAMERYAPEDRGLGADAPGAKTALVLRRQRLPVAIRVSVEHGRPAHIAASRRGMPYGIVIQAAGPWRISGGWWTDSSWNRNEWDVALKSGAVCRVYQDRTTDRWFLDGLYD